MSSGEKKYPNDVYDAVLVTGSGIGISMLNKKVLKEATEFLFFVVLSNLGLLSALELCLLSMLKVRVGFKGNDLNEQQLIINQLYINDKNVRWNTPDYIRSCVLFWGWLPFSAP